MVSENEEIYDSLMAQGKRAEADAYAEAHGVFEYDPLLDEFTEEDFDDPAECVECFEVFDSAESFITKPYRVICPRCGQIQPRENDWDYYLEY